MTEGGADANTDNTYMTEGGADTTGGTTTYMTEGGADANTDNTYMTEGGAIDANNDNTYMTEGGADMTGGTGMPATSYANDPAMMGTHASTVAPAVSDASGSSDATIPNPLDTVEAVDICADKHEDHWGTFLFYLSASWLLHAM